MLVSNKYKFIYIDIPKTGSTSARQSFQEFDKTSELIPVPIMTKGQFKDKKLEPFHSRNLPNNAKNYTKIITVRNPYDWMVSNWYFYNKKGMQQYPRFSNIEAFVNYCINCTLNYPSDEKDIAIYRHFPAWKYAEPIGYDIFLKLENINEEIKKLSFLPKNFKWLYKNKNKARPPTNNILTNSVIDKINIWAEKDFELFGYEKWNQ